MTAVTCTRQEAASRTGGNSIGLLTPWTAGRTVGLSCETATAFDRDAQGQLELTREDFKMLETVNVEEFKSEILSQEELFLKLAGDLPKEMIFQRELLISRL